MTAATETRSMIAWRQSRYGGPEAVTRERVDVPTPGPGEVLLRVRATSLNAADHHVMRGDPLLLRAAFGLRHPRIAVRGMDVAATVVAVGSNVEAQGQAQAEGAAGVRGEAARVLGGAARVGEVVAGSGVGGRCRDMGDSGVRVRAARVGEVVAGSGAGGRCRDMGDSGVRVRAARVGEVVAGSGVGGRCRDMGDPARALRVGDPARALRVGDEVVGELPGGGGLAEYAVAPESRLVLRPAALDPVVAATLPLAGGTGWQALELAGVGADTSSSGRRVLVLGASGGVGHFAVQLAAIRGAEVWATCGARSRGLVAELGAMHTFDYRTTDAADLPPSSFDAIVDIAGNAPLRTLKALLRPGGILVIVGGEGGAWLGPVARILRSLVVGLGGQGRRIRPLAAVAKPDVTRALVALAAEGRIRPVIERRFALDEANTALAHIDSARTVGKIVVEVGS